MKLTKHYFYLWIGQGISRLGSWIYLIALNLSVWHLTESPAVIAGLYMIGPIARIVASFFVGSIVDRSNKRFLLVASDLSRALVVCVMPFASSVWLIFSLVFLTNIFASFAQPSSTYMITKLIPEHDRARFNGINSILSSGSFMIGPALGGVIIAISSTSVAMWVNGCALVMSAFFMALLPNVTDDVQQQRNLITPTVIKEDFSLVWQTMKTRKTVLQFFMLYSGTLMIAHALDSQEASFLKDFHLVSDATYGIIVGVTGIGAIVGGILAASLVHKLSLTTYVGAGLALTLLCYTVFYASPSLSVGIVAFILLGFFMAFSNTGYATIFQSTVPPAIMGRFTSTLTLFESLLQITLTFIIGLLAQWYTIQLATTIFAIIALCLACVLYRFMNMKKQTETEWSA